MTKEEIKIMEEALIDRRNIWKMYRERSDELYYKGMVSLAFRLGYELVEQKDGSLKLLHV